MTAGLSRSGRRGGGRHEDPATARRLPPGASVLIEPCISMRHLQGRRRSADGRFREVLHILSTFCITILMPSIRNVGVLGASGYAGAELLRLLARHPGLEVAWAAGDSSAGQPLAARYPGLRAAYGDLAFCSVDEGLEKGADLLFCALPHGRAAELAPRALAAAEVVIDLSADFRLRDPAAYPAWYGAEHPCPDQLGAWPYGLPELHREELRGATRVAVPGCYPTAALLALAQLVAAGLVAADGIVVDAKSGLSGAGRALTAGAPVTVTFSPHLVPASRGLLATCYATLAPSAGDQELAACYAAAYGAEPFVDLLDPATGWPATRAVATTNRVQVAATADRRTGRVVAAAAIDNLVKGAAGQAVQCANLAIGLPETAGLDLVPPGS